MTKQILIIGHSCHDRYEDSIILGGAASYSGILSNALGLKTSILTSVASDFQFFDLFSSKDIEFINKPTEFTTCFENIESESGRIQYLYQKAEDLISDDLTEIKSSPAIVFICPIADEVSFDIIGNFKDAIVAASIQGWLRTWNADGLVESKIIDWSLLKGIDILFFSENDFDYLAYLTDIKTYVKHIVVTKGEKGADIYHEDEMYSFGAYQTNVVDTTGAGDTFSTAYLIEYERTEDIESACIFAHCAASLVIEEVGIKTPNVKSILKRVQIYTGS